MENKKMYALTWCYEGCDDNYAHAVTMAVSYDKDKLIQKMKEWVEKDCEVDEDDNWNEDKNFEVYHDYGTQINLQHKFRTNLYTAYTINEVEIV